MVAPISPARYIPAAVKRAVYERDQGQCRYVDESGRRCTERNRLEYHHNDRSYGRGGDHSLANIQLACSTHNGYLAEREYGKEVIERHRKNRHRQAAYPSLLPFNHSGTESIDRPNGLPRGRGEVCGLASLTRTV